jgi:hypothetical protein
LTSFSVDNFDDKSAAAQAAMAVWGELAMLRTCGVLLEVKPPLLECPFWDAALKLLDVQDEGERGRLSRQQFRDDHFVEKSSDAPACMVSSLSNIGSGLTC